MKEKKTQLQLVREMISLKGIITPANLSREDCIIQGRMIAVDSIRRHLSTLHNQGECARSYKKGITTYFIHKEPQKPVVFTSAPLSFTRTQATLF